MLGSYIRHSLWPVTHAMYPIYEARFISQLKKLVGDDISPKDFLCNASDGYLFWLMVHSHELGHKAMDLVPLLPAPQIQRAWTGATGEAIMGQAFAFYRLVTGWVRRFGNKPLQKTDVLDFGCGWGRILRFFLREIPHRQLHGRDCWGAAIEQCQLTNRWCDFQECSTVPPTDLPDASMDLVYLFSVFSHLNEDTHLLWLKEFHRVLRPGGLLVATTRPRGFLELLRNRRWQLASKGIFQSTLATSAFPDIEAALRSYDKGEYCFSTTGGGGGPLEPAWYGETCIPEKYVRAQWRDFTFLDSRRAGGRVNQDAYCMIKAL